jgi:hypothetical protein
LWLLGLVVLKETGALKVILFERFKIQGGDVAVLLSMTGCISKQKAWAIAIVGATHMLDDNAAPTLVAHHLNGSGARGSTGFTDSEIATHEAKITLVCIYAY